MPLQQVSAEQDGNYWMNLGMGVGDTSTIAASKEGSEILLSADEIPAKVRKPYTITKQRERWTDEEHQKFLEALKLHGRAWRRIEEHIGTKTAVQIRSHAQKFFSKLEREASTGASSAMGSSPDIDIPPPRPKRKPTHPYPRKAIGTSLSTLSYEESSSRSPPAVCSPFKPLVMNPQVWQSSVKVSEDAPDKTDVSSSLRLFGQTVIVASDTVSSTDADHIRTLGSDAFAELGSTYPSNSHVSMDAEMSDHVSLPCTRYPGDLEKNRSLCEPEHAVSETRDSDSSICLCHAGQYTTDVSATSSGPTVASQESVQSGKYPHPLQAFPGSFAWTGSITDGSCFTPWHPSFAVARHHLTSSLQTLWERRPAEDFTSGQNEDANAAAAAAATFAVASAWQVMHGGVLPFHNNHPNMVLMYNPSALGPTAIKPAMKRVKPMSGLSSRLVEKSEDVDFTGGIGMGHLRYDPKLCGNNAAYLNVDSSCSPRDGASAGSSHNQPMSNTSDSESSDIIDAPTPKRRKTEAEQDGSMKNVDFPSICSVHSTHMDTVQVTKFAEKHVKNIDKRISSKDACKPAAMTWHSADSIEDANPEQMSTMLSGATGESKEIDTPENIGIPPTAKHHRTGITKVSVSHTVTKADTQSEYISKSCVVAKIPDGNGETLHAGGYGGGHTGTEACSGSLLFMVPTRNFVSRARYSGAGFVPYKKLPKTESTASSVDDAMQQLVPKIPSTS